MGDKYQLYPSTVKLLAVELKTAIDDYNARLIDANELRSLVSHYADNCGNKMFLGPGEFNPTVTQRLGARRLQTVLAMMVGRQGKMF
ncbi:MAG: hypothetical protein H6Q73_2677 [Firmicutes bacterium]|nr:hypothetical protein [Bacillota bacterium]